MRARILILSAALLAPALAQADSTTETALRAALQQATTQIAALENQVANLQAAQAPDTAMIEALKAQVQTLQKGGATAGPAAAAKPVNDAEVAALRHQLSLKDAALAKSQQAAAANAATADQKTAQSAQLTSQLAARDATINSCDAKNAALFKLGNQILDAFSHKDDVFAAIGNHEPFIGFSRVQLQNIVQNDQQTMLDNQIIPGQSNGQ
jgi:small-conductance mechanosensitive channel